MADVTSRGFRYPENSDIPNIAVDIQNLAEDVDDGVGTVEEKLEVLTVMGAL
jgi:uncharacterized lipoprotein YajG